MIPPPPISTLFPYTTLFRSSLNTPNYYSGIASGISTVVVSQSNPINGIDHHLSIDMGGVNLVRSEEHTSELHSHVNLVCRLLLEKKKKNAPNTVNTRKTEKN